MFYYRTSRQGNTSWTETTKKSYIKFRFAINLIYILLILPKPLIFALATLHILFIWIPKFSLLSMVTQISFTNFDDSILLLFITTDWLIVFLFRIMNWNYPGLAILWVFLNQFHAIFRSAWRFFKTPFTDLAQLFMVLSSAKLQMSVFFQRTLWAATRGVL